MAFKAKNAPKCKHQWSWPLLQTSIDPLDPVANLISPNHRIPGFVKFFQPKQGRVTSQNFTENRIFPTIFKMFFIFAPWVCGPQVVPYKWVWSKMSNSIMILQHFLGILMTFMSATIFLKIQNVSSYLHSGFGVPN